MLCEPRVRRGSPASAQTFLDLLSADVFLSFAPRIFQQVENAAARLTRGGRFTSVDCFSPQYRIRQAQRGQPPPGHMRPDQTAQPPPTAIALYIARASESCSSLRTPRSRLSGGKASVIRPLAALADADQFTKKINSPGDQE